MLMAAGIVHGKAPRHVRRTSWTILMHRHVCVRALMVAGILQALREKESRDREQMQQTINMDADRMMAKDLSGKWVHFSRKTCAEIQCMRMHDLHNAYSKRSVKVIVGIQVHTTSAWASIHAPHINSRYRAETFTHRQPFVKLENLRCARSLTHLYLQMPQIHGFTECWWAESCGFEGRRRVRLWRFRGWLIIVTPWASGIARALELKVRTVMIFASEEPRNVTWGVTLRRPGQRAMFDRDEFCVLHVEV